MNWEALGAVAEAFGAVGVIGTLVYLSIQIRQNTSATRSAESAYRSTIETELNLRFHDIRRDIYSDPDLTAIYHKGLYSPDELDEDEWFRFSQLLLSNFLVFNEQFQVNKDLLVDRTEITDKFMRELFRYPGARAFWSAEIAYDPVWAKEVQSIFETTQAETKEQLMANPSPWVPVAPRNRGKSNEGTNDA